MSLAIEIDQERLAALCRRYHVAKLEVFGSHAKGTARPDSDVDLLVSFETGKMPGLAFVALAEELESFFGRSVDLLVKDDAVEDRNEIRRTSIMANVEVIYAA